jgi:hypothetical protein
LRRSPDPSNGGPLLPRDTSGSRAPPKPGINARRIQKVKRSLFALAVTGLALAAALPASAQINTGGIPNHDVTPVINLAEAYPCDVGTFADNLGITPLQTFCPLFPKGRTLTAAAPGTLCLNRKVGSLVLDVNCFAITPSGQTNCVVQAFRFFKMVPGSFKCPDVFGTPHFDKDGNLLPFNFIQFGTGIRTWWSLNFTQPGTRFLLQVVSACQVPRPLDAAGNPIAGTSISTAIHMDSWRWRVVADAKSLEVLINLMHGGAISTLEVPCIIGEDMFDALITAVHTLQGKVGVAKDNINRLEDIGNAIFDMEALVVANCLFVEVLNPLVAFPGPDQFGAPNIQPPGNLAQTVFLGKGSAVAGIIDTIENPCCCKLLVDLEWIALREGLTPTNTAFALPSF